MNKFEISLTIFAVFISLLICSDELFPKQKNVDIVEMPSQSSCSDLSDHHHQTINDHFFQKASNFDADFKLPDDLKSLLRDRLVSDFYFPSIWQPPKNT